MKKLLWALCCISAFIFVGCNDGIVEPVDDLPEPKPVEPSYYFQYKDKKYELTKGFYQVIDTSANYRQYFIKLVSSKVKAGSGETGLTGTGNGMGFLINVAKNTSIIPPNTYPYKTTDTLPDFLSSVRVYTSYDFSTTGTINTKYVTNGTLTIAQSGSYYVFDYSGTDKEGVEVKCFYIGSMEPLD